MNKNKKNILGVDIGGSKIRMVLWDGKKVLQTWQTQNSNLENFRKGLEFFSKEKNSINFKIGIGLPGLLDFKKNKALFCKNLSNFNNVNLQACFPVGIKIDNDAKCFLRAEVFAVAEKKPEYALGVIFGTGIGGAIQNHKGQNGWAGEFGHMIISKNKTWEKLYQETKNEPQQQEEINAIGLANLINIFNPEVIFLGGKGAQKPNLKIIERYLLVKKQMPKFVLAKLRENAVAIGAALLW